MKKFSILFLMLSCITGLFAQPCSNLFISEYVEGSGNNKAIELYNASSSAIDMTGYRLVQYNNGGDTVRYTINLVGTVNPYDVYVLVNSQGNATIKGFADSIVVGGVLSFNGNDVIALLSPNNDTLDRIGVIGVSADITFADSAAVNSTYLRNVSVQEGTKDWAIGTTQWARFGVDVYSLGGHLSTCAVIADTLVSFAQASGSVSEDAGTFTVNLQLNAASAATLGVDVVLTGGTGTAADINNYTSQAVSFAPGSATQTLALTITDDQLQEGPETLVFTLRNTTGNVLIGADSVFTLTIGASDVPAVVTTIGQITTVDTAFVPDSLGVAVAVTGTVYGIDFRAGGLEFFINDGTGGIQVFSPAGTFGYTVTEGDSIAVTGEVGFFSGIPQIGFLDTIIKIGTGTLPTPMVVQDLDESTEAELVRLNNVHLVTPGQWNLGSASGFNVDITDGQSTWTMRIDEQTDIFTTSMAAPSGNFDVIGIGSQFDGSAPHNSGYQILPRYKTDILEEVGINEADNSLINVYPNPNSGNFIVALNEQAIETEVRVLSLTGAVVYAVKSADSNINVNTNGLSAGLYIVEATTANKVSRSKVQINK